MAMTRRGFLASCLSAGALAVTGLGAKTGDRPRFAYSEDRALFPDQAGLHRERWQLFGTRLDVAVPAQAPERMRPALAALSATLQDKHRQWHAWKPGHLQQVNQAIARGETLVVEPTLAELLTGTQRLHAISNGAFNPAIGGVVALWGFHNDKLPVGGPPAPRHIDALLADQPSPQDVVIEHGVLRSSNRRVQFDLGGYAKGYALDKGLAVLRKHGIADGVISAGGDLVAMGRNGDRPWRVAVRHPQGKGVLAWMETQGYEAVFTSGNYARYRKDAGKRYTHILDPRTGTPVSEIVSATVVHHDAALADAAATALVVAGSEHWHDTAVALGVRQAMIVDQQGRVQTTRALAERLQLSAAALQQTLVV